jgi:amidase
MVLGKYLRREYDSTYYSKAQNLRFAMIQQVDRLLEQVDVLVTPTTPMKAIKLLSEPIGLKEMAARATSMSHNSAATNVTGHPSLTIPCGVGENGLPVGLQSIGRRFEESLLFRVAYTLEQG